MLFRSWNWQFGTGGFKSGSLELAVWNWQFEVSSLELAVGVGGIKVAVLNWQFGVGSLGLAIQSTV